MIGGFWTQKNNNRKKTPGRVQKWNVVFYLIMTKYNSYLHFGIALEVCFVKFVAATYHIAFKDASHRIFLLYP